MRKINVVAVGLFVLSGCRTAGPDRPSKNDSSGASAPGEASASEPSTHHQHHQSEDWTLTGIATDAKLLEKLGNVHRPVTTSSVQAQAFFDQGLALAYGFNHDEAARSFAKAAQIDPTCALCFWGVAYTLGPNYNMPMLPERAEVAWQAITSAQKLAAKTSPVEQALIGALAKRFAGPAYVDPVAMQAYNEAYAQQMAEVARRFPTDMDVQALYAESMMNVNPWKLWTADGQPAPGTEEIVAVLEGVLAREPQHAGANHFYIHAVEASKTPQRAIPAADRLPGLVPGAGHIVHMPAHIYQRVGRYADASDANRRAAQVDEAYLKTMKPLGYYPFYVGHNYGFLAYSASMEGRYAEAIAAARDSAASLPMDIVCGMPGMDFFLSEPLLVMVRFGRWNEVMGEAEPAAKYPVLVALWHHAQGMAKAATGKPEEAKTHAAAILRIAEPLPDELMTGLNTGQQVLKLAAMVVHARAAEGERDPRAIDLWQQAVTLEDGLGYNEPADWFYPVRHYLGAALLDAGRARDAEQVFRADLERHPKNGWALFGLWKALQKQKKPGTAAKRDFQSAWKNADTQLARAAL